jgi:hypothetical protein
MATPASTSGALNWSKIMECPKNLPHFVHSPAKTAKARLMFTTASKSVVSRAKPFFATPAKRNTARFASLVQRLFRQEAVEQNSVQTVRQKQPASIVATHLKKQATRTVTTVLNNAVVSTSKSFTLVAITLQRSHAMILNAASVIHRSRLMFTTLIYLAGLKRPTGKGVTTI